MSSSLKIYTDFFGLEKRPFTLLPDPDFIYWSTPHKQAYTMLEYGMLTCAPITLITGEIGAGKTTLLRELLKQIPQEYSVGLISNAQGDRGELLHWVLMSLGQAVEPGSGYVHLFHQFQTFLVDNYAQGKRTVLIFDEAQNLSVETLEELRMFSNINADTDELLQLILVGQPQLCDLVSNPKLVQFAQRIAAEFHLPTMNSYERKEVDAATIQQVIMDRKIYGVFNTTSQGQTPFNTANTLGEEPEPLEPPIDLQERAHKNRT